MNTPFWELLGLENHGDDELVADQGLLPDFSTSKSTENVNPPKIELLEPTAEETPVGKFILKRGPGVQQICFRVEDLDPMIRHMIDNGVNMIDKSPRIAGGKKKGFIAPKSTGGVLVELTQY